MPQWYKLGAEEVLQSLGSGREGLTAGEAEARLARHGPNELQEKKTRTALMMFLGQFNDFLIIVLVAAAVMAGAGRLAQGRHRNPGRGGSKRYHRLYPGAQGRGSPSVSLLKLTLKSITSPINRRLLRVLHPV